MMGCHSPTSPPSKSAKACVTASRRVRPSSYQTVQRFIENVLEDHERRRRLAVAEAMGNADERTLDEWRAETDVWEAAEADTGSGA
jgi:hypothetical protein